MQIPAIVGAGMKRMLVNCKSVSFALLVKPQNHLLSCQTTQLVIMDLLHTHMHRHVVSLRTTDTLQKTVLLADTSRRV